MLFIDPHSDPWHRVCGEDGPKPDPDVQPDRLLSLEQWHAVREHWPAGLNTGLALGNTVDVLALRADLPRLALIVLDFPKWTDGRAYSQARLLRSRLGFSGQLRAAGDALVDMLPLLQRTGFDAVQLRADQDRAAARRALGFYAGHYQADITVPAPLFARLAA
jgi:uncharacterized protein (DUF934 family)